MATEGDGVKQDGRASDQDDATKSRDNGDDDREPESVNGGSKGRETHGNEDSSAPRSQQRRGVSFQEQQHPRNGQSKMASSTKDYPAPHDDVDSSADERTGILSGAHDNRDYQATGAGSSAAPQTTGADMQNTEQAQAESESFFRRRKGKTREQGQNQQQEKHGGWWTTLFEKYGSVELENKGSVARDHLALERTFLAWLRTSLSFASIGIAITQLFRLNTTLQDGSGSSPIDRNDLHHVGKPLGATFIGIAIVILFIGFHRYFESQHYVIRGKFPASRGSIFLVTLVGGSLIVASLVVILSLARGTFD